MAYELVNAVTSALTLVVLAASVGTAVVQLRHMRAGNELEAVLSVERHFRSHEVQDALVYVAQHLAERMTDTHYRQELCTRAYIDPRRHPELTLLDWFNQTGVLVSGGFLNEDLFLDAFGRLVDFYWQQLSPVIALMRQSRGPSQYQSFEYLAFRARARTAARRHHRYPRNARRLTLVDPWLAADRLLD